MIPRGQYRRNGFFAFVFPEDRTRRPNVSRLREAFPSLDVQSRWCMYSAPRPRHDTDGRSLRARPAPATVKGRFGSSDTYFLTCNFWETW